jgi:D-alanyl-D-alanine carboxypeptidase
MTLTVFVRGITILIAGTLIGLSPARAGAPVATPAQMRAVADTVQSRAAAAGFNGAILIGDVAAGSRTIALGTNPIRPDAIWRWASITKQLAAVLAMQEVASGRLDLDAPVTRYWPDWSSPNAGSIRIRHLLLHNSGLPQPDQSTADGDGFPAFYRSAATTPAASAAGFCAGPPRAAAPAEFEYNNCDTIVLAEVLRRITGRSFEQLVRERFARPLRMRRFGIYSLGPTNPRHVAPVGEFRDVDGFLNMGVYGASGGAYGTIDDLWRFDRALLRGQLLATAGQEMMWNSSRDNGFYGFLQWIYPAPLTGCAGPVRIVERQGLIGGIEHRNYLLPETGRVLILFSRSRPTNLGDPWEGRGLAFDLLSAVACRTT